MTVLDQIGKARILVLGDVMLDRYWWGSVERISPEAPVPIVRLDQASLAVGGAANVAANLAGLGAVAYLTGVTGNDAEGDLLSSELVSLGIDPQHLVRVGERPTTVKTRIVAHSQHVVRIDHESASSVDDATAEAIVGAVSNLLPSVDCVLLSDYGKGVLSGPVLTQVIAQSRTAGKRVIVDPKGRDFTKYAGASMITPNKREAAEAAQLDPDTENVVLRSAEKLLSQLDLEALLITEGEHGMTLFENAKDPEHLDALAHQVFDVTGAGDTVIATLAAAVASGADLVKAARLANAAAGIVVGSIGTTRITAEMLTEFLATQENAGYIHA